VYIAVAALVCIVLFCVKVCIRGAAVDPQRVGLDTCLEVGLSQYQQLHVFLDQYDRSG